MTKKLIGLLLSAILIPAALFAQSGKVAGKVTDSKTGEALALANIIIEGTTFGAATNENGEYVILNVAPGTYTVKARYLGYSDQSISNIVVNAGLTRTVNFKLSSTDQELQTVEVIADRPLINPNITNSTAIRTSEDIANLPVRGVNNIVALQGGVVSQGGNIYVRGGRSDETKFYVDGVNVTDPVNGGSTLSLIDNAIEEIQVQIGGAGAEYGGANGGVVSSSMKRGGNTYKFNVEYLTDGFGVDAEKTGFGIGNGFTRGYNEVLGSIGGPIPGVNDLVFYTSGRFQFREAPAEWRNAIDVKNIPATYTITDVNTLAGTINKDTVLNVSYPNYRLDNERSQYDLNGNISYNFTPFSVKYSFATTYIDQDQGTAVGSGNAGTGTATASNIFNRDRVGKFNSLVQSHVLKFTQTINPEFYYTVSGSFYNNSNKTFDPYFKDNLLAYGDPADPKSFYVYNSDSTNIFTKQSPYSFAGYSWNPTGTPVSGYVKNNITTYGVNGDFTWQIGRIHEFKGGFEYNTSVIRRLSVNPQGMKRLMVRDQLSTGKHYTGSDLDAYLQKSLSADAYGYDINGKEVNGGLFGAKKPTFAAAFISDKLEYQDLILNIGVRWDYIDSYGFSLNNNVYNTASGTLGEIGYINPSDVSFDKGKSYFSPRFGLSMPVTDKTTFHANYGQYVQQTQLRDIYLGYAFMSRILLAGGNAFTNPVGYNISPTRTTSYEIGFKQQVTDNAAFDLTAFYNNKKDQIQIRQINAIRDNNSFAYYGYGNGDFATTYGLQSSLTLRRVERVQANVNYTFSTAKGTGSTNGSQFGAVRINSNDLPSYQVPLDFNQTHRGSIEIDYRFGQNDGPEVGGIKILERFGANILYTFNSGVPFTRVVGYTTLSSRPTETTNASSTPWVTELGLKLDKSVTVSSIDLNFYVKVENLFNAKNTLDVYNQSGVADNDGYLDTIEGQQLVSNPVSGAKFQELYKAYELGIAPGFYNTPRTIVFGIKADF